MVILSINFLVMVAITVLIYWILPSKYRWMSLLVSSCIFIWYANEKRIESGIFMFVMIMAAYFAAMIFNKLKGYERIKKIIVSITILFEIGMLIMLKDSAFFQRMFHIEDNNFNCIDFFAPIGMSYFTLSIVGYLEFPQIYPQTPDFISTVMNNFQKMPKI